MKHKRNKRSRLRGRRTCGYGSRKKHRGKGSKGGKGMAGTGKRADHRKTWIWANIGASYWGKHGFKSKHRKPEVINLGDIERKLNSMLKEGVAKKTAEGIEITLENYKVLGEGSTKNKLVIKAESFSKNAIKKIEKAGGKAIISAAEKKEEKEEAKKAEERVEKEIRKKKSINR